MLMGHTSFDTIHSVKYEDACIVGNIQHNDLIKQAPLVSLFMWFQENLQNHISSSISLKKTIKGEFLKYQREAL